MLVIFTIILKSWNYVKTQTSCSLILTLLCTNPYGCKLTANEPHCLVLVPWKRKNIWSRNMHRTLLLFIIKKINKCTRDLLWEQARQVYSLRMCHYESFCKFRKCTSWLLSCLIVSLLFFHVSLALKLVDTIKMVSLLLVLFLLAYATNIFFGNIFENYLNICNVDNNLFILTIYLLVNSVHSISCFSWRSYYWLFCRLHKRA